MSLERFRRPVVTASERETVATVAQRMRDQRTGCVVLTRENRPIGILTDRDVCLRVVAEGRSGDIPIAEVATYDPFVLRESDGIETAVAQMRVHGVRRFPIVDAKGNVTGVVTADDLIVLLGREIAGLGEGLEASVDATESR